MEILEWVGTYMVSAFLFAVVMTLLRNWREIRSELFKWRLNRKIGRWLHKKREIAKQSRENVAAIFFSKDLEALCAIERGLDSVPCYKLYELIKFYNVPMIEAEELNLEVSMMGFRYRSPGVYWKMQFMRLRSIILESLSLKERRSDWDA